jgi:dolichol-phosphate mannosyltransferase
LTLGWCVLFYSLSGCKSPPYIAPALAPLSLLLGACVEALLFHSGVQQRANWSYARQILPWRATVFILLVSAGCYLLLTLLAWQNRWQALAEMLGTLLVGALWWRFGRQRRPAVAWTACAAATLFFNLLAVQDLVAGFASRHSPASAARLLRHWPGAATRPVIAYARQWPSASFYLRRDLVSFCDEPDRAALIDFLQRTPETLVLVEHGPLLDDLLGSLPRSLEAQVIDPKREGQVTLLVVRQAERTSVAQTR